MHSVLSFIVDTFAARGDDSDGAERVTQRQHTFQCAVLAPSETGDDELVAAALLHDLQSLVPKSDDDAGPISCRGENVHKNACGRRQSIR